jgi:NAD+--asparagine ADP-ribosyltransferase
MYNCIILVQICKMKMKVRYCLIFLICCLGTYAQVPDTLTTGFDNDSIAYSVEMPEVLVGNNQNAVSAETKKQLLLLKRRTLKVYPYAKIAADRLTMLSNNMAKLKTDKEKKKYSKIVEKYLENEFEGQLKKLTRKEGQILIKLIHRQTGQSAFDLIKEHKSGWKAFWSARIAKLFDLNLKTKYDPNQVLEDFYIEGFLMQAFDNGKLVRQQPAFKIDYDALADKWLNKE